MQVDEELALTFTSDARILPYALQNFSLFKSHHHKAAMIFVKVYEIHVKY